uniref:Uncharacterized protein MANES_14G139500 n=1 Tax=Rhizophora mucronata TaxID=61149 RepID=A0A2P2JQN4_RHIMU
MDLSDRINNRSSDLDESQPVVLVDSKENQIVAYLDETPPPKPNNVDFIYDYNSSFIVGDSMHQGLGFCEESDATKDGIGYSLKHVEEGEQEGSYFNSSSSEKEIDDDKTPDDQVGGEMAVEIQSKPLRLKENAGFISIGGMKLFTEDISDEESDEDLLDDQTAELGEQAELSESDDSEDTSDCDLDIDKEVAEDYLEGIGGGDNILDATWLAGHNLDDLDDDSSSSSCLEETMEKLGGIALQEASRVFGMEKSYSKKKGPGAARDVWSSALDDLMLVKDPRTISGRKKRAVQLAHSWPSNAQKSKSSRRLPGEKKKQRKESIAIKRRERMLRRGVDLEKVNMTLEQIVLDEVDMFSFQPMHSRDCSQVQRLAAVYRLHGWSQGSGKKRL